MNKLFSKIATLSVGLAMAVGVGVALGQKSSVKVEAAAGDVPTGNWTKISSSADINTTDEFLLGYENGTKTFYANGTVSSKALQTNTFENSATIKFVSATGGYRIMVNGTEYLGNSSGKTDLFVSATESQGAIWSLDNNLYLINSGNNNRFLGAASASDNAGIKAYASGNKNSYPQVFVYKYTGAAEVLDHITVSGSMTVTTYTEGTKWNSSGLTVTAYYESSNTEDVTSNVEWSFDPATPAMGVTSVVATATYETKEASSDAQSVTVTAFVGYTKVASLNNLSIGDSYVVGDITAFKLMGSIPSTKSYREAIDGSSVFSPEGSRVSTPLPDGVVVVTLLAAGENAFKIYDISNDKYIICADGSTDVSNGSYKNATVFNASFSDGQIRLQVGDSDRYLGYNISSPRFSSLKTGTAQWGDINLYKIAGSAVKTAVDTFCTNSLKMDQYAGDETYDAERCVANYTAAKTAYQALSDAEVNVFINASEYADAKTRFANWAAANGDNFNDTTGAFVRYNPTNFIGGDTSGYAIIIVVVTSAVLAFGLAIMLRKKHR